MTATEILPSVPKRKHSTKRESEVDRFWRYLEKADGDSCWTLVGIEPDDKGYFRFQVSGSRKKIRAHVLSWIIHYGPIPAAPGRGLFVCHKCDNRACVRPDHLFLGTNDDNINDMMKKNRQCHGAAHKDAKLTEDSVRAICQMLSDGMRQNHVAHRFGVSYQTIQAIRKGRKWRYVTSTLQNFPVSIVSKP